MRAFSRTGGVRVEVDATAVEISPSLKRSLSRKPREDNVIYWSLAFRTSLTVLVIR